MPCVGKAIKEIHKLFDKYFKSFIGEENDLITIKNNITKKLAKSKLKYIVFIDDIDRLNNKEIKLLMQLIKAVGDFPNIIYVLAFDRDIVANALNDEQKINGGSIP